MAKKFNHQGTVTGRLPTQLPSTTVTNNLGKTAYQCYICSAPVGKCGHTAGYMMRSAPGGSVSISSIMEEQDYEAIQRRISYIHEIKEYLDDKFLEYFVAKPITYDNGDPRLKHQRKQQGRGALFVIERISGGMLRQVVLPALREIAARHHKKVTVRGYLPKGRCMLRCCKVQVS